MTYRENVSALAAKMGVSNDPGLLEEDLTIASLRFWSKHGEETDIVATDMNHAGRLFFQFHLSVGIGHPQLAWEKRNVCEDLLANAKAFFAENWPQASSTTKRPLLDALHSARMMQAFPKHGGTGTD